MSMSNMKSCLENLANEILMEIFEYLYGQQIYFSFFNLNFRFNLLCTFYPKYHIDTGDLSIDEITYKQVKYLIQSKHILSVKFRSDIWYSQISTEYFLYLHSLTFINVEDSIKIKEFIEKLPSPNQLHYLSISFQSYDISKDDLVSTIFKLPNLNRLKLNTCGRKLNDIKINQPLLSLRHLSINCYESNHFLKLIPFIPNLISLNLSYDNSSRYLNYKFIQSNYFSKLKYLQINNVHEYYDIEYIFQLCPQIKIFQVQCYPPSFFYQMIEANIWKQLLLPMKYLQKIEIYVYILQYSNTINLLEYETEFWIQRNLKACTYYDQKLYSTVFCIK